MGASVFVDAGWAAGEDEALGVELGDSVQRRVVGQQLAVDAAFAHAAGDQQAVLGAEVEDDDGFADAAAVGGPAGGRGGAPSCPRRGRGRRSSWAGGRLAQLLKLFSYVRRIAPCYYTAASRGDSLDDSPCRA